jgi:hypothetical protein
VENVEACYFSSSIGGSAQSAKHSHGGCLSGSIGTEETEDFPFGDREGNMVNGYKIAELLG